MTDRERQFGDVVVTELDDGENYGFYVGVVGDSMPYEESDIFEDLSAALAEAYRRLKTEKGKVWLERITSIDDLE